MAQSVNDRRVRLALSESVDSTAVPSPWIGPLVALGGMTARYARVESDRQLIVAISVPRRDFAAVLVGCGWVITQPVPPTRPPLEVLNELPKGSAVRLVTEREVVLDEFVELQMGTEPIVKLKSTKWMLSKVTSAAAAALAAGPMRTPRPNTGALGDWANITNTWDRRLVSPSPALALVGTAKWLREDMDVLVTTDEIAVEGGPRRALGERDRISELLLPRDGRSATWFSEIYPSSKLADQLPLGAGTPAAILDGAGATKYIGEIDTPVVICIVDRSISDDTAAEILVQLRNSRGEPFSLKAELGWRPPAGVEAFAFTVAM